MPQLINLKISFKQSNKKIITIFEFYYNICFFLIWKKLSFKINMKDE